MNPTALKRTILGGLAAICFAAVASANPAFAGRWRLDPAQSSPLDGWTKMDLILALEGPQVAITHEMQLRATRHNATNVVNTEKEVAAAGFFRVEQRHMAVYPAKGGVTHTTAAWIDGGRTLRTESLTPVEVSQGDVMMRITSEYRLGEGDHILTLIELHSSRNRPLIYIFKKIKAEDAK